MFPHVNRVSAQKFTRNAKNGFERLKLYSEVEILQFLTTNLCGYDLGLEAGSRQAIISNLAISLVP